MAGGARPGSGRKVLPINVKQAKGTLDKSREKKRTAGIKPVDEIPLAPEMLNESQKKHFDSIVSDINGVGQASKTFVKLYTLLAIRLEEIERYDSYLLENGIHYQTSNSFGDAILKHRPEYQAWDKAMRHAHTLLTEVGLTHGGIVKIPPKPKEDKGNDFEGF